MTVGGEVRRGRPLLRSGARPGDVVWVSGTLGDARLGLGAARAPRRSGGAAAPRRLRVSFACGDRIGSAGRFHGCTSGQALVGVATACIDLSDGLVQDAGHVAAASAVAFSLALGALPCSPALVAAVPDARRAPGSPPPAGEDYELLFTAPPSRRAAVTRIARRLGLRLTPIGEVRRGRGVHLAGSRGPAPRGFDHLA